ncbi:MAG: Rrf2 family transcriptional regulator [Pirellulales bacterium]|nr:Rrf2 family transcriptional regulator [Pirellulales bacterium]
MKLTRSVSYAVGVLQGVLQARGDGPVPAATIARSGKYPPRFLYRILRRLVDAGLLTGTSGPGGGYSLARPARRITLLEIVTAVEGKPTATKLAAISPAQRAAMRTINRISEQAAKRFRQDLAGVTLAKLARGGRAGRRKRASTKRAAK